MYDFYFGTREEVQADEPRFLLSIKRMLPKWMNSIPDSEFLALCHLLQSLEQSRRGRPLVLAEAGAGASSLALAYFAMKTGGRAYSWDLNGEKGSQLRSVMTETFGHLFTASVNCHWRLVAFSSTSPHVGLGILGELEKGVDFYMHDSHHVLQTVLEEFRVVDPFLRDGAIVALDDAHYDFVHTDEAYVNIVRRKLGLPPIAPIAGNRQRPFYEEVETFLTGRWRKVVATDDFYRRAVRDDIFFSYFDAETQVRTGNGAGRAKEQEHRLHAWRLARRRASARAAA